MGIEVDLAWLVHSSQKSTEEKSLEVLRSLLVRHLESQEVKSSLRRLRKMASTEIRFAEWEMILSAILLIETRERPRIARVAEWLISLLFLRRGTTCGRFQMRGSPFRFSASAEEAVERLERAGCQAKPVEEVVEKIARFWHGAASRQPGESVGYAKALVVAMACIDAKLPVRG